LFHTAIAHLFGLVADDGANGVLVEEVQVPLSLHILVHEILQHQEMGFLAGVNHHTCAELRSLGLLLALDVFNRVLEFLLLEPLLESGLSVLFGRDPGSGLSVQSRDTTSRQRVSLLARAAKVALKLSGHEFLIVLEVLV